MKTLSEIAEAAYANCERHGWNTPESRGLVGQFVTEQCNNLHDEVSELHSAWRKGDLFRLCDKTDDMRAAGIPALTCAEEELADIILRACYIARWLKVDLERAVDFKHRFNLTRPFRHGGRKT